MRRNLWTIEEENVVLSAVKDNPGNLKEAFEAASQMIDRSPKSIMNRWYKSISRRTDRDSIALVCVSNKTYGINRKNCASSRTDFRDNNGFRKLWMSITRFFGA